MRGKVKFGKRKKSECCVLIINDYLKKPKKTSNH